MIRELFESKYKFTAGEITFEPACKEDIPALARMYGGARITKNNYKKRFDPGSEQSFGKLGGLFDAHDKKYVGEIFYDPASVLLIAKRSGKLVAALWISSCDPALAGYPRDEKTLYFREIMIVKTGAAKHIFSALIYTAISVAVQTGYTHALAEIYKLTYYDDGVRKDVEILNERSYNAALLAGGKLVGQLPEKITHADGIECGIASSVIAFEFEAVRGILEERVGGLL
jgi:hypothetical protein